MFTKFLHDVEALVPILMRAHTRRCCIPFWNGRATSEGGERIAELNAVTVSTPAV